MAIDIDEATDALNTVAASRRRATELRNYASAGNALIGWGVAWLAGNLASQFTPHLANWVWFAGIAGATLIGMIGSPGRGDARILGTVAAALGFFLIATAVLHPDARQATALISLLVAASYVVLGLWTGHRFVWLGLLLVAAVLAGWFAIPAWLYLCLAIGGGGTLIAGGWWLRQA